MSDLFHEEVPDAFIAKVFALMNLTRQHTFQVLTKRAERVVSLAPSLKWTPNIWMGVTADSDAWWTVIPAMVDSDSGDAGQRFRRMVNTFRW